MKRKTLIVLLVLLLVGILAFTVFACNNDKPNNPNDNNNNNNNNNDDNDDNDDDEEETYAIVEALPKLVTGLDKVAATVGDINEGKAAYLGADIGLNFGVTAEGLDVAADLVLSLKVSVDEDTAANNWALIGLNSDGKEVAQLFIHAEAANKEVIYIKEALTGNDNWKRLSVLDTSASKDLTGLFTTPGGADLDSAYNDEDVEGFDKETGYHHVYNGGLIGRLFGLIDVMTNGPFAKPITDKEGTITGYEPEGGKPVIDFTADSPIGGLEIMEGSTINSIVGLVGVLGEVVDGALHAEAFDNGNRYVATLNRAGIGSLVDGVLGMFGGGNEGDAEGGLFATLEALNPVLRLVLGMEVKDGKFNVLNYDDPADAPVLDIEFSVDPDSAALTDLAINFSNGDIEGMGIKLGLALSNIELSGESKAPETETAGAEDLGINLDLEAKLPAWAEAATIAVSVDPEATIGWDKNGKIQIDLSNIKGYATFNGETIAEYTTLNIENKDEKGFAIDLGPVYDFIAPLETGVSATDLRDKVYFIKCDLAAIVTAALNKEENAGNNTETIQNAALADQIDLGGTLGTLVETIMSLSKPGADILGGIGNIIGPALTDSNSIVKLLLAEITSGDSITFDPELGEDITTGASVTVNASALVDFVMGENLLGGKGFDKLLNIQLYDFSAAQDAVSEEDITAANAKKDLTLKGIFDGDIIEVALDLIYTAMYEGQTTYTTFVDFAKEQVVDDQFILAVATAWDIDEITNDGKLKVSEIGNITAGINLGDGIHVTLEALGAYVSLGADLDAYKAPTASIDTTGAEVMGDYTDQGKLVVAFNGSDLEKALLELAGYALAMDVAA